MQQLNKNNKKNCKCMNINNLKTKKTGILA